MSDHIDKTANYCPECGATVENAESVAVEDDLVEQGTFEKSGAHLIVEGSMITVFSHKESGA